MESCLACELTAGERELPGGRIHETQHWVVEHCVGPLGVGTLIVKPRRHITHVWDLDGAEASELGPLLQRVAAAIHELLAPEQLYVTLWSHAGGTPVHIHWVLQPVGAEHPDGLFGPHLQVAMFDRGEAPPPDRVETVAAELRGLLA
jgi:diadenosine tetraphosphate (Ap4A) HIT family hydrolase